MTGVARASLVIFLEQCRFAAFDPAACRDGLWFVMAGITKQTDKQDQKVSGKRQQE